MRVRAYFERHLGPRASRRHRLIAIAQIFERVLKSFRDGRVLRHLLPRLDRDDAPREQQSSNEYCGVVRRRRDEERREDLRLRRVVERRKDLRDLRGEALGVGILVDRGERMSLEGFVESLFGRGDATSRQLGADLSILAEREELRERALDDLWKKPWIERAPLGPKPAQDSLAFDGIRANFGGERLRLYAPHEAFDEAPGVAEEAADRAHESCARALANVAFSRSRAASSSSVDAILGLLDDVIDGERSLDRWREGRPESTKGPATIGRARQLANEALLELAKLLHRRTRHCIERGADGARPRGFREIQAARGLWSELGQSLAELH